MGNSGSKGSSGNSGGSGVSGNDRVCRGQDFFTTNDGERGICFYAPKSNSGNGGSGSYPSGTGRSGRDGGSDESKESGREYSSYTSSVKYSTTGLRKLHNDYLQSKFSTFDVGYGQIHSNAIIGTNHFSQGVPFVNEVVTTIRGEVSKGTLHHKLAINASNRGLSDYDLWHLGTQLSGSSGTTTSGVTLNLCLFDLHQNNITHLGMNNFLHFFKWQNINEVNFSSNQLGDNSCRQLGQAFSAAWLPHLFNLNLSNNQIGDSGGQYLAQSLTGHFHNNLKYLNLANNNLTNNGITPFADGLSSGKITKLKTLHLEGNKFSPDGEGYLVKAMQTSVVKHMIVITQKLEQNSKLFPGVGTKEEKIAMYREYLKQGIEKGTNNQAIVVDKSFRGELIQAKNQLKTAWIGIGGFIKCNWKLDEVIESYAQEKLTAKVSKTLAKILGQITNIEGVVSCYLQATDEMYTSVPGQHVITHKLDVMGESEFSGD